MHIHNYAKTLKDQHLTDIELKSKISHNLIFLGGNRKLKIYGTLHCKSGKRL